MERRLAPVLAAAPDLDETAIAAALVSTLACADGATVWTWRWTPQAACYLAALSAFSHGDKVELCLQDGGQALRSMSLNELGDLLPANVRRVHRSHIVNTAVVKSLTRRAAGGGRRAARPDQRRDRARQPPAMLRSAFG